VLLKFLVVLIALGINSVQFNIAVQFGRFVVKLIDDEKCQLVLVR
jgi:hypothetical protein